MLKKSSLAGVGDAGEQSSCSSESGRASINFEGRFGDDETDILVECCRVLVWWCSIFVRWSTSLHHCAV